MVRDERNISRAREDRTGEIREPSESPSTIKKAILEPRTKTDSELEKLYDNTRLSFGARAAGVHYRLFSVWTLVPVRLGKQLSGNSTVDEIASDAGDYGLTYTMANCPQRRGTEFVSPEIGVKGALNDCLSLSPFKAKRRLLTECPREPRSPEQDLELRTNPQGNNHPHDQSLLNESFSILTAEQIKIIAMDLVILNRGQVTRTTPELAPKSQNFKKTEFRKILKRKKENLLFSRLVLLVPELG
ncbi:hypothetical protein TNCV_3314991 [Trichonephila clavipes]|nr:hypothetical protein TNCV_3314991 [Trichonephila clavipes]